MNWNQANCDVNKRISATISSFLFFLVWIVTMWQHFKFIVFLQNDTYLIIIMNFSIPVKKINVMLFPKKLWKGNYIWNINSLIFIMLYQLFEQLHIFWVHCISLSNYQLFSSFLRSWINFSNVIYNHCNITVVAVGFLFSFFFHIILKLGPSVKLKKT